MSKFIGIDIGASFIKGAVFDINRLSISNIIKYPSPQQECFLKEPPFLRFETNPHLYERLIRKLVYIYLNKFRNIEGIVFSTQMHGMILVDSKLTPLTKFIGWQDERVLEKSFDKSTTWLELIHQKIKSIDISQTGTNLKAGFMGSTLFWLKENKVLNKHKDSKALFLGDYMAARLSNGKPLTDPTNAAGSGIFNVKNNRWDINILNKLGIDISHMPTVVTIGTATGYIKVLNKQIPVFVSTGDLQTAVLGSFIGINNKNDICINIGTGSQISFVSSTFKSGNYDIRSYFDNTNLYTITHIPAGRALNVLIKFVEDIGYKVFNIRKKVDLWDQINHLLPKMESTILKSVEDTSSLTADLTFFKNNFTGLKSGSFTNITEDNWTLKNMFISAFANMAENYWAAYSRLRKNEQKDKIIFAGGLARKIPLLRSLISKKFNKEAELASYEEETLTGLFIISLFIQKDYKSIREASLYCQNHKLTYI